MATASRSMPLPDPDESVSLLPQQHERQLEEYESPYPGRRVSFFLLGCVVAVSALLFAVAPQHFVQLSVLSHASQAQTRAQPNVVLIVLDDIGYADVGYTQKYALEKVYGADWQSEQLPEVKTPNIDALAGEGVAFTSGYVTGQICAPTRAGLMLGRYQQGVGIYNGATGGWGMEIMKYNGKKGKYDLNNPWIPQHLKQAGADYVTGAFGKWHLGLDDALKASSKGIYEHNKDKIGSSRKSVSYSIDTEGDSVVYPNLGPMVEQDGITPITKGIPKLFNKIAPLGRAGSPYHPLYRGFDVNHIFMGRGAHDYWDPNGIYVSMDTLNPNLGKFKYSETRVNPGNSAYPYNTAQEPVETWDADAEPYVVNTERTPSNYMTNNITNAAIEFIRANAKGNKPFFAYVPYSAPHFPRQTPYHMNGAGQLDRLGKDKRRYAGMSQEDFISSGIEDLWFRPEYKDKKWFPDPLFIYEQYKDKPNGLKDFYTGSSSIDSDRRIRAITTSMIRWADKGIGQIVATLKDADIFEDTMIIVISDNGGAGTMRASNKPLNGGKQTPYEGGYRVPFLMSWPSYLSDVDGVDKRGALIDEAVVSTDILATILDVNGINDPSTNPLLESYPSDGKSLLPLISGKATKLHEYLFWAEENDKETKTEGAVRKDEWKLIINNLVPDADPYELYNLETDLGETTNLIDQYPQLVEELKQEYVRFMNDMALRSGEKLPNYRLPADLRTCKSACKLEQAVKGGLCVFKRDGLPKTDHCINQKYGSSLFMVFKENINGGKEFCCGKGFVDVSDLPNECTQLPKEKAPKYCLKELGMDLFLRYRDDRNKDRRFCCTFGQVVDTFAESS